MSPYRTPPQNTKPAIEPLVFRLDVVDGDSCRRADDTKNKINNHLYSLRDDHNIIAKVVKLEEQEPDETARERLFGLFLLPDDGNPASSFDARDWDYLADAIITEHGNRMKTFLAQLIRELWRLL
jgi:hypothetical protein